MDLTLVRSVMSLQPHSARLNAERTQPVNRGPFITTLVIPSILSQPRASLATLYLDLQFAMVKTKIHKMFDFKGQGSVPY